MDDCCEDIPAFDVTRSKTNGLKVVDEASLQAVNAMREHENSFEELKPFSNMHIPPPNYDTFLNFFRVQFENTTT